MDGRTRQLPKPEGSRKSKTHDTVRRKFQESPESKQQQKPREEREIDWGKVFPLLFRMLAGAALTTVRQNLQNSAFGLTQTLRFLSPEIQIHRFIYTTVGGKCFCDMTHGLDADGDNKTINTAQLLHFSTEKNHIILETSDFFCTGSDFQCWFYTHTTENH